MLHQGPPFLQQAVLPSCPYRDVEISKGNFPILSSENFHFCSCPRKIFYKWKPTLTHIWFNGQRSIISMVNVMFVLFTNRAFSNTIESVNSKCFARVLKSSFLLHELYHWRIAYSIYNFLHIYGETSFCPQLRHFHFFPVAWILFATSARIFQVATVRTIR